MQKGDKVVQRYEVIQAMQTAWLAADIKTGQNCLLKSVTGFIDTQVADYLGKVWHAGLPRLLECVHDPVLGSYYVFEYLEGRSIAEIASIEHGQIPVKELLPLMIQAAKILAFLHKAGECVLMHLDFKPEHLILNPNGEICLIDFGAAQFYTHESNRNKSDSEKVQSGSTYMALTKNYAAPEQLAGTPCPASDIFAFGLTLAQLLTGLQPEVIRSNPLSDVLPALPDGLNRLIGRCLHSDLSIRYNHADEIASDLAIITDRLDLDLSQPALQVEKQIFEKHQLPASILTIWDGAEFGCELAAVLAEKNRILVIDADLLKPQADLLLGVKPTSRSSGDLKQKAGLDQVMTEEQSGHLDLSSLGRLIQTTQLNNINVLTNQFGLEHYEYYHLDAFNQILHLSRLICDLVIILCSRFIFDAFTCLSLIAADEVIIPLMGDSGSFREYNRYIDYLQNRHQLDRDKLRFAAFSYNPRTDLSWGTMDELCGGRLIGCISARDRRRSAKSSAKPYAMILDRINHQEYQALIRRSRLIHTEERY